MATLRERKRRRTRQAIVDAAVELFERDGYDGTTIADIAAAADIGTRTFFSYFASKEEVLFPDADGRVEAALAAIADHAPDERPADVLLRALRSLNGPDDMVGRVTALRLRLVRTVPAVRGRGLQIQLEAQQKIAQALQPAFPDDLDEVSAAALVGAFVGAVSGALQVLLASPPGDPDEVNRRLYAATDLALRPWLTPR
ncbi:TetR/AcrR family transcriptional regulator [Fodinicola acaciae]|uniref:TetR/AcrR family transcriptional regulator n=1 Tax=Fodinicola acaciae TaxID=2681555 RepID=UPI0013D5CB6F|nr:TetR/AcrR family transcriptional regulator [Fodinicola acaciae]